MSSSFCFRDETASHNRNAGRALTNDFPTSSAFAASAGVGAVVHYLPAAEIYRFVAFLQSFTSGMRVLDECSMAIV